MTPVRGDQTQDFRFPMLVQLRLIYNFNEIQQFSQPLIDNLKYISEIVLFIYFSKDQDLIVRYSVSGPSGYELNNREMRIQLVAEDNQIPEVKVSYSIINSFFNHINFIF